MYFSTLAWRWRQRKDTSKKQPRNTGVEIEECRPKINIVKAVREHGIPFMSKRFSQALGEWQKKGVPMSIIDEYEKADDKAATFQKLVLCYPKSKRVINFLLNTDRNGVQHFNQLGFQSEKYLREYIERYPPDFQISAKCCDYCKKQLAHRVQKGFDMVITGERKAEGGVRAINNRMLETSPSNTMCFFEQSNGQHRFRPLYYVSNKDKQWYKDYYGIRYSDAYEVYGLTRTGCCGRPISYKAVDDLELIRPYEPNVVKAAWNIFGKSYEYRRRYNEYKAKRREEEKRNKDQITFEEGDR